MLSEIGLPFPNPLENINDRNHQIKKNNYRIFFHEISSTTQKKTDGAAKKAVLSTQLHRWGTLI